MPAHPQKAAALDANAIEGTIDWTRMQHHVGAYQEGLLSLDELRERMPNLRRREQADNAELHPLPGQVLCGFVGVRLRERAAR